MLNQNPYQPPDIKEPILPSINENIERKNWGFKFTLFLSFIWLSILPFVWAFNFIERYEVSFHLALLSFRPELISVFPSALLLIATWKYQKWAIWGLFIGTLALPLLKFTLGGFPSNAHWIVGSFLLLSLALRLRFLLKMKE
jgi:hypothetical protein